MQSSSETSQADAATERRASELIVAASRFVRAASRHRGRDRSPIVLRTLSNLLASGPMRIGDLAVAEHITQPTMTGVVKRMEIEGLVARESDPDDGRAWLVAITPAGQEVLEGFRVRAGERVEPALAHLTEEERATLWSAARIMGKVTAELNSE
jgi:DNA-binding MarR family transcriptional regulator